MRRIFRKGLSILLALSMILTFIPGGVQTVHAADVDMRTTMLNLSGASVTYHTSSGLNGSANPTNTNITNTTEGWSWDFQSKTLTIDGINLITDNNIAIQLPANSIIVLAESSDNTVTSTYNSDVVKESFGIYCAGALTIQGTSTLSVQSGNTASNFSVAIYAQGNLTISDGSINASGGAASMWSMGLYSAGNISITGGTITADGSDVKYSYGIGSKGNLSITGGTVNASGGVASISSRGLYCEGNFSISEGTVNASAGAATQYSIGIWAKDDLSITGGTIIADGASDGTNSYGIRSEANLTIAGGTVNVSGGADAQYSVGIWAIGNLSITGGIVTADGRNAIEESYGILVSSETKTATFSGGTVYASGGDAPYSTGIGSGGDISVMAGTVTATGNHATEKSYGILTYGLATFSSGTIYAKANNPLLSYAVYAKLGITDDLMTALQKDSELAYTQVVTKENVEEFYTYLIDMSFVAADIRITEGRAAVSNKTVTGMTGIALSGTDSVAVTLAGSTFANLSESDDVSDWFNNLPEGLSVTVSDINITSNVAELIFSGTPSTASDETMSITIPAAKLSTDSDIEVTPNSSTKFDITQEGLRKTTLDLTANNVTYTREGGGTGSVNPTSSNIIDTAEGWSWYKHASGNYSDNTLVLNGINLITNNQTAIKLPGDSTIVLADDSENIVESTFEGTIATSGITCKGALSIQDSTGSLSVTSGSSANASSTAFEVTDSLSIFGGTIIANSGSAYGSSMGFYTGGPVHISGGNITAMGGSATSSYGIRSHGTVTVTGGTVSAMGSTATGGSYGIFANTATFSDGVVYAKSGAAPLAHAVYGIYGITDTGMAIFQKDSEANYTIELSRTGSYYTYDTIAATDIKILHTVPPTITGQPQNQTVIIGQTATFTVTAEGSDLSYQWKKNGTDIAGETEATLTIDNAQTSDAGSYTVEVSNEAGSVTSNPANLTVNEAGSLTLNYTPGDSLVSLQWNEVPATVTYAVYQDTSHIQTVTGSVYSYEVTGLTNGQSYTFEVRAFDAEQVVIAESGQISATPRTVPGAPTNVTATAGNGQATVSFTVPTSNGGSLIIGYTVTANPGNIIANGTSSPITVTGLTNGTSYTFTVKALNAAGDSAQSSPSNSVTSFAPTIGGNDGSSGDDDNGSGGSVTPDPLPSTGVNVIVNGKEEKIATANTTKAGSSTIVTITVDAQQLEEKLQREGRNTVVKIPVASDADIVIGRLNGQIVKNMAGQDAVLEIATNNVSYILPATQINIDSISTQFGQQVALKDILIDVKIAASSKEVVAVVKETAGRNNYEIVVEPIEFAITGTKDSQTVEITKFNTYVERIIALPKGIDPSKITTGIVLNSDGSFSHVPTEVFEKDGKWYAKLNSLTNSAYSVIWNPITVSSVANHWSKEYVNDMASRLVIKNPDNFRPDGSITRGDFAEYITKALGVYRTGAAKAGKFSDVGIGNSLADAITIASDYGIISGYPDGTFKPGAQITREEAMIMYARAMDIVGLEEKDGNRIDSYADKREVSAWAYEYVKKTLAAGVFNGKTEVTVDPKGTFTYAEAATAIRNLLTETELINK